MFPTPGNSGISSTTSYKVVLPFYLYAALSFLIAATILFCHTTEIVSHYFHPFTLALTHAMALGWGTMIIMGASHQLVPVMIENKLYSPLLGYVSFAFAAIGIPMLVYGFYTFNLGVFIKLGGSLIIAGIISFLINMGVSMARSKKENVHAFFVFTATLWLLITAGFGLLLLFNFNTPFLAKDSITYLSLHAHMGMVGWFLLLVMGVGSRLIPMFLISKYENQRLLWWIYFLVNTGLIAFVVTFLFLHSQNFYYLPAILVGTGIVLFAHYCRQAYLQRIRKKVDEQMKVSLLAVLMLLLPIVLLVVMFFLVVNAVDENMRWIIGYGFTIFFGWITAIILGMTFKTLPFIIWNKEYHQLAGKRKTPNPKDLFSSKIFNWMAVSFILGIALFVTGILVSVEIITKSATALILLTALLYNWNVIKLFRHKPAAI